MERSGCERSIQRIATVVERGKSERSWISGLSSVANNNNAACRIVDDQRGRRGDAMTGGNDEGTTETRNSVCWQRTGRWWAAEGRPGVRKPGQSQVTEPPFHPPASTTNKTMSIQRINYKYRRSAGGTAIGSSNSWTLCKRGASG